MPDAEALAKLAERQEALIIALHTLTETVDILMKEVAELVEWANAPPSGDLAEALEEVATGMKALAASHKDLPEQVAALVVHGLKP